MVVRNEEKFRKRNKSKRSQFDIAVIRPETVAMMWNARNWLSFNKTTGNNYLNLSTFEIQSNPSNNAIPLLEDQLNQELDSSRVYLEKDVSISNINYE